MSRIKTVLIYFISFTIFTQTIGQFLPFQFSSNAIASRYNVFLVFALPISIAALFYILKQGKKEYIRTLGSIFICGLTFFTFGLLYFLNSMCSYHSVALFEQKSHSSTKILKRDYGCGAYDSDMPKYEIIKIVGITPFVNYYQSVDTTKIDLQLWRRLNEP